MGVAAFWLVLAAARAVAQILLIALIAFASPWLIEASAFLSNRLETLFARLSDFFGTPVGIGLAVFGLAIALVYYRQRYSRF